MAAKPPGKVQAIAIMTLISGILAILVALILAGSTLFLYIPWIYGIVVGIMAIIRGAKLMGSKSHGAGNGKAIPIMLIINIINCDFIALSVGIVSLVFQGDPEVAAYLEGRSESADGAM